MTDPNTIAAWGAPKEVQTKAGPRVLRKAKPTSAFWDIWRTEKEALKAAGVSCAKSQITGDWELAWWSNLSTEVVEARAASIEASKATAADVALPHPDGLDYMPFQKAGIAFALNRRGVLIGDEMGLGKTIQAIGIINSDPSITSAIVVCPKSLKLNWKRELARWLTRPSLIVVCSGKPDPKATDCFKSTTALYDQIRLHCDKEVQNVNSPGKLPVPLGLGALDSGVNDGLPLADKSAEFGKIINEKAACVSDSNLPSSSAGGNPSLAVNDASNISQVGFVFGDSKRGFESAEAPEGLAVNSLEVVSQSRILESKRLSDNTHGVSVLERIESLDQFNVGYARGTGHPVFILVINYEILSKWELLTSIITWDACICDEAHLIKNQKTQRSKAVKAIKATRKVRLTGTPIVNRPAELYNIIEDLCDGWGTFFSFAKRYCNGKNTGWGWDFSGSSNLDELQRRLRETIMVRRLKKDVLTELPRKIRQIVEVEADSSDQRRAVAAESNYESASEERLAQLRARVELSKAESEAEYKEAVAALADASRVDFTEMSRLRHDTAVAKIPAVLAHLENALEDGDNKIILAAHHHDVINAIAEGAAQFNPVVLTGDTSLDARQAAVDRFQNDPTCRLFIGSITAAGVGITLTASSHVVFAELDWVPGNVTQMEDRAHRIGQTETVLVQHLVLAESLDARMAKTIVEKQAVIDSALDANHPARTTLVYEPKKAPATQSVKPADLATVVLTDSQIEAVKQGLRLLAGRDMDFAASRNDIGFSKVDVAIGHSLAERDFLTMKQAALGAKLCNKYRRQLPPELLETIKGTE